MREHAAGFESTSGLRFELFTWRSFCLQVETVSEFGNRKHRQRLKASLFLGVGPATVLGTLMKQLGMTAFEVDVVRIGSCAPAAFPSHALDADEIPTGDLEGAAHATGGAESRVKRAVDVVGAGAALLFLAPLLLLVALAIFIETGGPVLFRQPRCGLGGGTFRIMKFRTMYVRCANDERQAERDDPRVTCVGRLLRRLSLDELPQLMNVLKGEMSLVGPRPHALPHDAAWAACIPGYAGRYRARPGLTGLAQVMGHRGLVKGPEDILNRVAADNAYIDRWSVQFDFILMARTLPLLFGDDNAH